MSKLIVILCLFFLLSAMFFNKPNYPISDHYDQKKFFNQDRSIYPHGLFSVLKWKFTSSSEAWPKQILATKDTPPPQVGNRSVRISSVGHATFLIQLQDKNILTDPVWSERVSPFKFVGPKRVSPPGIDLNKLPKIDIVLISHNHYDHLDTQTISQLWHHSKPVFITPLGNKPTILKAAPDAQVYELDWWQEQQIGVLDIHMIPSQHWSSRWIIDTNKALWGGFIIEAPEGQICFIGDSGYSKSMFKEIGEKFSNIIFAILPIGAYNPRGFMKDVHMDPQDALMAYQDLAAKFFIPSHFGVFKLTDEGYDTQLQDYQQAINNLNIDKNNINTLMPGEFVIKSF